MEIQSPRFENKSTPILGFKVEPSEFLRIAHQVYMVLSAIKDSEEKKQADQYLAEVIPVLKQVVHDLNNVAYNSDELRGEPQADLGNNHWAANHGWGD